MCSCAEYSTSWRCEHARARLGGPSAEFPLRGLPPALLSSQTAPFGSLLSAVEIQNLLPSSRNCSHLPNAEGPPQTSQPPVKREVNQERARDSVASEPEPMPPICNATAPSGAAKCAVQPAIAPPTTGSRNGQKLPHILSLFGVAQPQVTKKKRRRQ